MAQLSFPWPDTTDPGPQIGDGRPYTSAEWDQYFEAVFTAMGGAAEGVLPRAWNQLAVTSPGANQIDVDTGMGFVKGKFYPNNAVENLAPPNAGAGSTRKDSVILRCDWTGGVGEQYTVRVAIKQGDAANYPTMTQTDNTVWEIELYRYIINDSGAISDLTDKRVYCHFATEVIEAMLAAALSAKLVTGGDAHDHEDGEGAALGPGAITDRTRTLFIPVMGGRSLTSGLHDLRIQSQGIEMRAVEKCEVWGIGLVPEDIVSDVKVFSLFVNESESGNIYAKSDVYWGEPGQNWNTHAAGVGYRADTLTQHHNVVIHETALAPLVAGDIVHCTIIRDATDPLDTIGSVVYLSGFILQWTADS